MSERKVLNKYYPPDFDPAKIPRMKLAKNRQYTVRLMAPFNMRCQTCGEYIYKGKKFNARKEDVEGETYLGIRIYRFYIKCTRCLQEISFKTDPRNTDYEIEAGATRNFMALKLAEEQAKREEDEEKEEEATNPMKLLEKRTQQSKQELQLLESLEELKDLNRRQQIINYDGMLKQYDTTADRLRIEQEQKEQDEREIEETFKNKRKLSGKVVEVQIIEDDNTAAVEPVPKIPKTTSKSVTSCKSIISLADKRKNFGIKLKTSSKPSNVEKANVSSEPSKSSTIVIDKSINSECNKSTESNVTNEKVNKPSGLSLLGAYSDSSGDEN